MRFLLVAVLLAGCEEVTYWQIGECQGVRDCFLHEEKYVSKYICEAAIGELIAKDGVKHRACMNTR